MHTPTQDCKWVFAGHYRKKRRVWMGDDTGLEPVTSGLRVSGSARVVPGGTTAVSPVVSGRAFPRGAGRARRRVHHPGRVERRAPAALVVLRQVRSAESARSYEGMEHVANPNAVRRSWPRWSSTGYSMTWSA